MSHRFHPGDVVPYNGIPLTIAYVTLIEHPVDPAHGPGWFYLLRTADMTRDLYLLLPAHEVEFAADYHTQFVA